LSYLAGKAIDAVIDDPSQMVLPDVADNKLYHWIGGGRDGDPPRHGTLPNRFVVKVGDSDQAVQGAANAAITAIGEAWTDLAEAVWTTYVAPTARACGKDSRAIWDRQIADFWQVSWAVGDESDVLDRRKNWRSHAPPVEPGDKCTMMHRWQEISGFVRAQDRTPQNDFWEQLRFDMDSSLDLADGERLCAIALIKRLYPRVAKDVIGWELDVNNWPSTAYLAAAPWVSRAARDASDRSDAYAKSVLEARGSARGEWDTDLALLDDFDQRDFVKLDGNFFLKGALENKSNTPLDEDKELFDDEDGPERRALVDELAALYKQVDGRPNQFYALLLMDGDKMGALLREAGKVDKTPDFSRALGEFAGRVDDVVHDHDGIAVYAGGDDVLAMLTLPRAVHCAVALRREYLDCFGKLTDELSLKATISGGLIYAHYKSPLRDVLAEAHHLLDDIAKADTGRDSLAVAALKSSGKQSQWSVPFRHLQETPNHPTRLDDLVDRFRDDDGEPREFSTSFIYGMRRLFGLLDDDGHWQPGRHVETIDGLDAHALLLAEYVRSTGENIDSEQASARIHALLDCCIDVRRDADTDQISSNGAKIGFDAPLLARFLANQDYQTTLDEEEER
jgi:CRISPR-associated protein Cmr2